MSEMIERVAEAICKLDDWYDISYERSLDMARAAIAAMREPTREVRHAGMGQIGEWGYQWAHGSKEPQWAPPYNIETRAAGIRAKAIWQAMIDAALKE